MKSNLAPNASNETDVWSILEELCFQVSASISDGTGTREVAPWWRVDQETLVPNPLSMIPDSSVREAITDAVDTGLQILSQSTLANLLSQVGCPEPGLWIKAAFAPLLLELVPIALEVELTREIIRPLPNCRLSVDFGHPDPPDSVSRSLSPRLGESEFLSCCPEEKLVSPQESLGHTAPD